MFSIDGSGKLKKSETIRLVKLNSFQDTFVRSNGEQYLKIS